MRPLVAASDQPPAVRRAAFAALEAQVAHDADDPAGVTHLFTDIILPVFSRIDGNVTRTQARVAVAEAAASVLAAKAKTGAFPQILPAGLPDPYTNKPLNYHREGVKGFVVYSAGPTGHFDGGTAGQKPPGQESVFRYPPTRLPLDTAK